MLRRILLTLYIAAFALTGGASFAQAPQPPNSYASNQVNQGGPNNPSPESREARATEVIAVYTERLAWLTGVLAFVGIATSGLGLWQILLTRAEFHATHRPNVTVRFIEGPSFDKLTQRDTVSITFVNKGGSKADVVALGGGLGFWNNSEWEGAVPPDRVAKPITPIRLGIGDAHRHPLIVNDDAAFTFGFFEAMNQPSKNNVAVIGTLRYRDKDGVVRETGFHRLYDAVGKCWRPVKNSQYEYAD